MKRFILFIFLGVTGLMGHSQSNLSLKYFGLTIHPFGDRTAQHQPYKLDKNARVVMNYGAFLEYERFIHEQSLSIKFAQGIFADCSNGMAGATFLGIKALITPVGRHRIGVAIGPLLVIRRSWTRFPDYKGSKIFKEITDTRYGDLQYAFYPYGLDVEYDYRLTQKWEISVGVTPGFPFVMTFAAGVKYWFNKDFKEKERGIMKIR